MLMSSAVFAADGVSLESRRAYNSSNATATRLASSVKGIEVELKNNTAEEKKLSFILVKFEDGVCKGVAIADTVTASTLETKKIALDCGSISGIDTLKCIVVEAGESGYYPIIDEVNVFTNKGWKAE